MAELPQGEASWHLESYDLPVHNTTTSMRNFPGCEKEEYYTLDDIRNGDWFGSTDTDIETHEHRDESKTRDHSREPGKEGGYSKINVTQGKVPNYRSAGPNNPSGWNYRNQGSQIKDTKQGNRTNKPSSMKSPLKQKGTRG
jgi:hypothetical protein